jgi:serine protease AprX
MKFLFNEKPKRIFLIVVFSSFVSLSLTEAHDLYRPPLTDKIGSRLSSSLKTMEDSNKINIWVFFTDKGFLTREEYKKRRAHFISTMSERRKRRRERGGKFDIADFTDLPVHRPYLTEIENLGIEIRNISNWFNAASFTVKKEKIPQVSKLPFVHRIERVESYYLKPEPYLPQKKGMGIKKIHEGYEFNYGNSKTQDSLIAIIEAHNHGFFGDEIRIGLFDTGYWVDSTRFEALGVVGRNIIDQWDFINDDSIVGPELGDPPNQIDHGTSMLSLIGGFKSNELIGVAFNAEFALAKTEMVNQEIKQEEDNWAAAAEWADSCGADRGGVDIISSSLGYKSFDDTLGYIYDLHMNGDSAIITRAADLAVSKGIIVVTAMGNVKSDIQSRTSRPDTCIVAPADGDSVISAGAVDYNYDNERWEWAWIWINDDGYGAIIGPTADGRTKPDVCASWTGYHTNPEYDPEAPDTAIQLPYVTGQGTSVSTAMIAGGCGLILQAHPDWSPMQVRNALTSTASRHSSPNDTLGWGIANIWDAINYTTPEIDPFEQDELSDPYPNPFNPKKQTQVVFPINVINEGIGGKVFVYSLSGRLIKEINLSQNLIPGRYLTPESGAATWDGKDENNEIVESGIYIIMLRTGYNSSVKKLAIVR